MAKKHKRMKGSVQKIIKQSSQPEKAQIEVDDADELYRELRVKNETDEGGKFHQGEQVDVTIEGNSERTNQRK